MSHWPYLPFLLSWALPVLALQWLVGGVYLWRERRRWPWVVLGLGAYLSIADAVAIHAGVWRFDNHSLMGLWLGPVPVEEVAFYLLTVAMVTQGFVIAWGALAEPRLAVGRWRASIIRLRRKGGDRYQVGVWAIPLALAPGFLLTALVGTPTPLEPLTETVMQLTPVGLANALMRGLGGFAQTAALLGAIAITLPVGGLLGLCAPDEMAPEEKTSAVVPPHWIAWTTTAMLAFVCAIPLAAGASYRSESLAAIVCALAYVPALWVARGARRRLARRTRAARPDSSGVSLVASLHDRQDTRGEGGSSPKVSSSTPLPLARGKSGEDEDCLTGEVQATHFPTRRAFLRGFVGSGLTVAACLGLGAYDAWAGTVGGLLGRTEVIRRLFPFVAPRPRVTGFPVSGVEPEVTPVAHFYLLSKNDVDPIVGSSQWKLRVSGAVERPFELTYAQLTALPRSDEYVTLRCVNNPPGGHLMSTAYWSGVPLASLLARAGAHPDAQAVILHAPDGYDEVIPLPAALSPHALLAYGMNGETLPRRHGGPARALVPGYFGFKNVKWVEAIEVVTNVEPGYWARRGWTASRIHSVARIDTWQRTAADGVLVAGVAFGGARGVSRVEARVDGGPWQAAELNIPALSDMSWVQWRIVLSITGGSHDISARMVDGAGVPQIETPSAPQPGGATGLDHVRVTL